MRNVYLTTGFVYLLLSIGISKAQNQGVSINVTNTPPHSSAMLDVSSNDKGVLIPRMTYAERNAIASPAEGLMVFQTDQRLGFYYYSNGMWHPVGNNANPPGSIIMYSGIWSFDGTGLGTGDLKGWALCNGNNGTPNLIDKFVMGASTSGTLNQTGGNNNMTLTTAHLPSHTHGFTTGSGGSHSHTYTKLPVRYCSSASSYWELFCVTSGGNTNLKYIYGGPDGTESTYSTSSTSHTHTGTTNASGSGTAFDNRPAFVKLAYIMKL